MHRFFVQPDQIDGESVTLTGDAARQIFRVLRLRPGDRIVVLDDSGWEYFVDLSSVSAKEVTGRIVEKALNETEPSIAVTLYQAMIRPEKFEFVLQKATELGVSQIVPVICERSQRNSDGNRLSPTRKQRWDKIITEAAEQCGRGRRPTLSDPLEFADACAKSAQPAVIPWEAEDSLSIKAALQSLRPVRTDVNAHTRTSTDIRQISIFIGPEGGFTQGEIQVAHEAGVRSVTLGKRILRSETASIAAVTMVMYELGELER